MAKRTIVSERSTIRGEYKKYHSTPEQIRQNQRDNAVQRDKDSRARNESTGCYTRNNGTNKK